MTESKTNDKNQRHGPLHGVRILDLTTVIMGPAATQILGDLGADVIKVESPEGDSMRKVGPVRHTGMGPMYLQANRNKRSVRLDLKDAKDRERLIALAGVVDVVVSNIRPQALRRLGLDYATLSRSNPGVIFCCAVGYGSDGPHAGKAVYDDLMQAASGLSALFGQVDGTPRYAPINVSDRVVGLYLTIAIMAALQHRHATGEGQEVEVPMFETMAQFVLQDHMGGGAFVPPLGPMGYKRLLSTTRGPYPTKDGHLCVVVYTDAHWRAFAQMVGQPDLMERDPRFKDMATRVLHSDDMGRFLYEQMPLYTTAEWIAKLEAADIPVSPVNAISDLFEEPHLKAVNMFSEVEHPTEGTLKMARFPVRFGRSPATVRRLAPNIGEHTEEVLRELLGRAD